MALSSLRRSRRGLGFYCEVEVEDEESESLEIRDGVLEEEFLL